MLKHFRFSKKLGLQKNIINLFFWFFIVQTIFYFSNQKIDHPYFLGIMSLLSAAALAAPYLIYSLTSLHKKLNSRFLTTLETIIIFMLLIGWLGTWGLYYAVSGYDSFVHFFTSFLGTLVVFIVISSFKDLVNKPRIFIILFLLISAYGIFNEFFQHYGDRWWQTTMSGEAGQPYDSYRDVVYNTLGIFLGIAVAYLKGNTIISRLSI